MFSETTLRKQLTFNAAGSADDVEASDSAKNLTDYFQTRGYFDARVTWARERINQEARPNTGGIAVHFDRVRFVIDTGSARRVFERRVCRQYGDLEQHVSSLVATKVANVGGSLFGTTAAATSAELEILESGAHQRGVPARRLRRHESVAERERDDVGPGQCGDDGCPPRRRERQSAPTSDSRSRKVTRHYLTRVTVAGKNGELDDALCADILAELSGELGDRQIARRSDKDKCTSTISGLKFRYDDAAGTRDRLRDYLLRSGRARAEVDYVAVPFRRQPRRSALHEIQEPEESDSESARSSSAAPFARNKRSFAPSCSSSPANR